MKDYSYVCWDCDHATMKPAEDLPKGWYQCSECGATWIANITLSSPAVHLAKNPATGKSEYSPTLVRRKGKVSK